MGNNSAQKVECIASLYDESCTEGEDPVLERMTSPPINQNLRETVAVP